VRLPDGQVLDREIVRWDDILRIEHTPELVCLDGALPFSSSVAVVNW